MKKRAPGWLLGICWGWKTIHLSWVFWDLKFQTNKPPNNSKLVISTEKIWVKFSSYPPKIGKKFELPPPQTLTHPVSPHVLFPQTCLTTAPKMARFQLALRHRGLFFHVAPLHYLSPNEKRAPWLFWGCKGMKHYPFMWGLYTAGYIWCYIRNIARVYNWLFRGFVRDTWELRHLLSTWYTVFFFDLLFHKTLENSSPHKNKKQHFTSSDPPPWHVRWGVLDLLDVMNSHEFYPPPKSAKRWLEGTTPKWKCPDLQQRGGVPRK